MKERSVGPLHITIIRTTCDLYCVFLQKKCEKYWPENCSEPYRPRSESIFIVEMTSSVPFAEYTIRKMTIAKVRNYAYQGHSICSICPVINYCAM